MTAAETEGGKFGVGPDPIEVESTMHTITPAPINAEKQKRTLEIIDSLLETADEQERNALKIYKMNLQTEQIEGNVNRNFQRDFWRWLLGRGTDADSKNTPWGRKSVAYDPEVSAYLDQWVVKRENYRMKLALLKFRVPVGLNQFYLYFKYIVRGNEVDSTNFLQDFEILGQEFGYGRAGGNDHRDPEAGPHEVAPYGTMREYAARDYYARSDRRPMKGTPEYVEWLQYQQDHMDTDDEIVEQEVGEGPWEEALRNAQEMEANVKKYEAEAARMEAAAEKERDKERKKQLRERARLEKEKAKLERETIRGLRFMDVEDFEADREQAEQAAREEEEKENERLERELERGRQSMDVEDFEADRDKAVEEGAAQEAIDLERERERQKKEYEKLEKKLEKERQNMDIDDDADIREREQFEREQLEELREKQEEEMDKIEKKTTKQEKPETKPVKEETPTKVEKAMREQIDSQERLIKELQQDRENRQQEFQSLKEMLTVDLIGALREMMQMQAQLPSRVEVLPEEPPVPIPKDLIEEVEDEREEPPAPVPENLIQEVESDTDDEPQPAKDDKGKEEADEADEAEEPPAKRVREAAKTIVEEHGKEIMKEVADKVEEGEEEVIGRAIEIVVEQKKTAAVIQTTEEVLKMIEEEPVGDVGDQKRDLSDKEGEPEKGEKKVKVDSEAESSPPQSKKKKK